MVINLASGFKMILLNMIFMRRDLVVNVPTLPVQLILLPLTVRRVQPDSLFLGRTLHWKLLYVAYFLY